MISTNVNLFINYRWEIKLTFEMAQYVTAQQHRLMKVKHNALFQKLSIYDVTLTWHYYVVHHAGH